ncbi:MAG: hypothetical protein K2I54_05945 [Muribaculaceae bacterium]|nr:hypothetical protein [Muribaculaceae bacterium]
MKNNNKRTVASVAAHVLSDVFSPMLLPSYAMIAALTLTPMCLLPTSPKIWATAGVAFITAIIPMLVILILIRMGKVSDVAISNRNERTAPFCATILCYIGAAFFVRYLRAPYWIQNFYLAAAMVSAISLLVTQWWKISAHTGAMGGFAGIIFWMAQRGLLISAPLVWICAAFLVLGLVAWARLYLNKHTVLQTLAGATLGFTVELIFLNITPQVL